MNELRYQLDLLKAMNQSLSSKEKMYRLVCEKTDGAFLYYSFDNNEIVSFGKWKDYFGFTIGDRKELEQLFEAVEESYETSLRETYYLELDGKTSATLECPSKDKKNWFRFQADVVCDKNGNATDKILQVSKITNIKHQKEELAFYAYYDELTGLYNRNYFIRLLDEKMQDAAKEKTTISLMMIDIDDFHNVNDGLGMIAGDELIQQLGCYIKEFCDDHVMACHLNTDVYCVSVYGDTDHKKVLEIYDKLTQRNRRPYVLSGGNSTYITVTIGVAEYPEAAGNPLELINCAEIVMLKSKSQGKDSILFCDGPILQEFREDLEIENGLKEAMSKHQFELYFQPQYYAGNNSLRGMEALIRWKDQEGKMISPSLFIPIAERNGAIVNIGNWVVEEAIRQYAVWLGKYGCQFIMSINISARQLNRCDFVDFLLGLLDKYKVDPFQIELEITESILIENFEQISHTLQQLQNKGIRISLDDFGTGFSSLSYLKGLPINTLKIDKSFVDTVLSDSSTRIITESIVNMVKALGCESVAEGVEQEQQLKYLHAIGCDAIQGFFLGRPIPVGEIEKLLENQKGR